jgi:O-antigen ligase
MFKLREGLEINDAKDVLTILLLLFAFFLPISISLVQPVAYLAIPVFIYVAWNDRLYRPVWHPVFWPIILFAVFLLVAAVTGPNAWDSVIKSRRILLLTVIFIFPVLFKVNTDDKRSFIITPILFFVAGTSLLGVWDIVRVPWELSRGVSLYDTGNMRDPQLYLVGGSFLLALWIYRPVLLPRWFLYVMIALNSMGMILHFKRGVWLAFMLTAFLICALTRRYRLLIGVLLVVCAVLAFPQTRERLELLKNETLVQTGGRYVLWTQVAPHMIADYPLGTGFRGLEHEDYLSYSRHLQPGLNHLHNNILQVFVDAGWLGGLAWLFWMGMVFISMMRLSRKYHERNAARATVALGCMASFIGLMLNGMVEYNFGNSVIFMTLILLMGLMNTLCYAERQETITG